VWPRDGLDPIATIEPPMVALVRASPAQTLAALPQRTIAQALEVEQLAEARLAAVRPGSDEWERLRAAIIELQQVVSILSDTAHQTPDAVERGRDTVDAARQVLAEVSDAATSNP
jgi:hypothetical protein